MGSNLSSSEFKQAFTIHTGTDIFVVFNETVVATVQGISYSITRQKAPIYTMGSENYRAVARSKRGIAGSLVLTNTDRHALSSFMQGSTFAAKPGSFEASQSNPNRVDANSTNAAIAASAADTLGRGFDPLVVPSTDKSIVSSVASPPTYSDSLLPFDITLSAANEMGVGSVMRILGAEILNEGSGLSIDDTSNEIQMTYIARLILPWTATTRLT